MSNKKNATQDMLAEIFKMQADLNNYVFQKNELKDHAGMILSMDTIFNAVNNNQLKANDLPNIWLSRYAKAMAEEQDEFSEELLWKWWSRDGIDIQNIRVELIDILHFLVSAMMCAGLTPERVFDIYEQKHKVNIKRQDSEYSRASKMEDDNKEIR